MNADDLMSGLGKVFTKRFIKIGFWIVAAGVAVGFAGVALGWWGQNVK